MKAALVKHTTLPTWYAYTAGDVDHTLGAAWSGDGDPPAVGAEVFVDVNGIGHGKVVCYFTEHGYLGLMILPADPPIWYAEQNGIETPCHIFGLELGQLRPLPNEGRYRRARVIKKWRIALAARR